MSLVGNEKTKLTAAWLNAISAASIAIGGIGQVVGTISGSTPADREFILEVATAGRLAA